MKKNAILIGIVVVVGIILVFVFTNKTTTIDTDNGSVEVTQDNETIIVNTSDGTLELGEDVSIPDNFPSDVHVIDGTLMSALGLTENDSFSLMIKVDKEVSDIKDEYTTELESDGWSITATYDLPTGVSIFSEKDNRIATVIIATENEETIVSINTGTNPE